MVYKWHPTGSVEGLTKQKASGSVAHFGRKDSTRRLLLEVQQRLPAGQRRLQEAFTTEHRRPVFVKVSELAADTFYWFDAMTAQAFRDAVVDLAAQRGGARLTLSYPFYGEFQAQQHRLQRLAPRFQRIRVLATGPAKGPAARSARIDYENVAGNPLARYSIALAETDPPLLLICREQSPLRTAENPRSLGFFSFDADTVEQIAEGIEILLRGLSTRLEAFERLQLLHQTTQRISRELESYSRRMELAVRRARRRPELLTPARFQRIVNQAIAKLEQLKEIPRRALRSIDKARR
jgi:hypothetical protein